VSRRAALEGRAGVAGDWLRTFVLHVATGFIAVAAHHALMYGLLKLGLHAIAASALGFCAGALTRFALSYFKIFSPSRGLTAAGVRFVFAIGAQAIANTALLAALLEAGLSTWVAQVATTILLTFANFLACRLWVFR
jgi:putative flippase GtrA